MTFQSDPHSSVAVKSSGFRYAAKRVIGRHHGKSGDAVRFGIDDLGVTILRGAKFVRPLSGDERSFARMHADVGVPDHEVRIGA